jgi:hypothetical protein
VRAFTEMTDDRLYPGSPTVLGKRHILAVDANVG